MKWTKEQEQAISIRGTNLLVSAGAGSGKTAVLVERIIRMVSEEEYDIDRILVVTFTKAAAAEMKERIGSRLLEESIRHPEKVRIQEQSAYIHRAPISTIHSFCTNLLRNHFHMISIDPNFRIGEEGEAALLKEQVLSELLEEQYAKKDPAFLKFVEAYSYGKDDGPIEEMIYRLFNYSISHPDPKQWLLDCLDPAEGEPAWIQKVGDYADKILADAIQSLETAIEKLEEDPVLSDKYALFFQEEKKAIEKVLSAKTYEARTESFSDLEFKRFPTLSTKDEELKKRREAVKKIRDEVKKTVQELYEDCYRMSISDVMKEQEMLRPYLETLILLVLDFSERYLALKLEKNMLEFHDLEHFALQLLVEEYKDGKVKKTPLAKELSGYYQAVFTDEYQDSNLIQEVLLTAVSRQEDGNRFMVGDIKQSIYKFRMARPEIFLEKYELGRQEKGYQTVELKNNFRSRPEVLHSINYIFYQIMKPSLGDVLYDKKVALTPPEGEDTGQVRQEILILNDDGEDDNDILSSVELEARMIAERIKELRTEYHYRDMVILLRSMEGWGSVFEEVLTMEGIPVYTETRTGYFDTFEIRVLLNFLLVVDNVYQDIPMAAVLRSPIGGFTGGELAGIRSQAVKDNRAEDSFYDELLFYLEHGEDETIRGKIEQFVTILGELRKEKTWLSLTELIWSMMDKTGYYHFVGSMPNGQQRMANIRMFLEKAKAYEKTGFKGVFHFIRYIEKIRSYQIDYGKASVLSEDADVVRIMTIHKSKGLEFPVVFLSGLGKKFNFMDRNKRMLLHPDYHVGLDCINLVKRTKRASQKKKMISRQLVLSMLGEELRILYVAMTRAKEKLVLSAYVKEFHELLRKYGEHPSAYLSFLHLSKATNYLSWILPALLGSHRLDPYRESHNINTAPGEYFDCGCDHAFTLFVKEKQDIVALEMKKQIAKGLTRTDFLSWIKEEGTKGDAIEAALAWEYPKKKELKARSKWSVSQLKEESMEPVVLVPAETEENGEKEQDTSGIVPKFLQEEKEKDLGGASRGTAVHSLMEHLSFKRTEEMGLSVVIDELIAAGKFDEDYKKVLPMKAMKTLLSSDLGKRLKKAEENGSLFKEAQFMIGVPMKEMEPDTESEELVLVQGIIDIYMKEEDGIVLLDYKTDFVPHGDDGQILVDRYRTQLLWYKKALEQMTGLPVKETFIYSFSLAKTLTVDKQEEI